jgi:hypothetical protein
MKETYLHVGGRIAKSLKEVLADNDIAKYALVVAVETATR